MGLMLNLMQNASPRNFQIELVAVSAEAEVMATLQACRGLVVRQVQLRAAWARCLSHSQPLWAEQNATPGKPHFHATQPHGVAW